MMDPMLIEALLIGQRPDAERGNSTPSCAASRHPSAEEIHSPVMVKSEAGQLVAQELMKALSNFKQLAASPSTPPPPQLNNPLHL
jgi:hypothetical protein